MSEIFPVESQRRMCERKRPYLSELQANVAIAGRKARDPRLELRSYRCPACSFWHLTSKPLRVRPGSADHCVPPPDGAEKEQS